MKASLALLVATCASSTLAASLGGINPDVNARDVVTGDFKRTEAYPVEPHPSRDIEEDDEIIIPDAGQGKGKGKGKGKGDALFKYTVDSGHGKLDISNHQAIKEISIAYDEEGDMRDLTKNDKYCSKLFTYPFYPVGSTHLRTVLSPKPNI
ncbi:hypothetical protein TrVGV298_007676 [Trichoderma virens]|nr:hypothetical protein TrVGV298_007676 [Trichoderma virens]